SAPRFPRSEPSPWPNPTDRPTAMNRPLRGRTDTHRAIAATGGIALMIALAACGGGGGGNGPGSTELNLVIGNSLPLSGTSKTLGESGQKASELALVQI